MAASAERSPASRSAASAASSPAPDAARHHGHAVGSADALGFPGAAALHRAHLGRAQQAAGDPAAVATLRLAADPAERAGDLRLLAATRVALAQALLAVGDRDAARELLEAADRWYAASGAGDDAALAADLLAGLRSEHTAAAPGHAPGVQERRSQVP